jgi:hypothetical protein
MWFLANDPTVGPSFRDFDLSRHKSLQTLEVLASTMVSEEPRFLTHVLPTIASPAFSEVILIFRDYDFFRIKPTPRNNISYWILPAEEEAVASFRREQLEALHEMHKVRDFQPVLCADVWDRVRKLAERELEQAVAAEKAKRGLDVFSSKLSVISRPQGSCAFFAERYQARSCIPWTPL